MMIMLPKHRPPTSPGRLLQRFLDDHGLTQTRLAELADMQLRRVNEILKMKRAITPDTALRLARFFNTTPDLWLNAQTAWELWHAQQEAGAEIAEKVVPLSEALATRRPAEPHTRRPAGGGGGSASPIEFAIAARAPTDVRRAWATSQRSRGRSASAGRKSARASMSARRTQGVRSKKKM